MIPTYLSDNPFPGTKWTADMKPVAVLDGVVYELDFLNDPVSAEVAYFVGVNQKSFEKAIGLVTARVMHFYEMRVADISQLVKNKKLQELAIHWNTKLEDISPIARLDRLKSLVLEDTPKVFNLLPIAKCTDLECLEYSGGIWSKNKANSLEYIAKLPALKYLRILNTGVESGGLKPLSNLTSLLELDVSNQFPTEDYAFLSVRLEHVKCACFAPYVDIANPISGKDVMVIGSRKPFLNKKNDATRLTKYKEQFESLRKKYAAEE